jgi:hypothetical protein
VPLEGGLSIITDGTREEVVLYVGVRHTLVTTDESAALKVVCRTKVVGPETRTWGKRGEKERKKEEDRKGERKTGEKGGVDIRRG